MRTFKIKKYFKGGSSTYFATLPKNKKMKRGCWSYQLKEWGELTDGGHNEGYNIKVSSVTKIPKIRNKKFDLNSPTLFKFTKWESAPRLIFNDDYIETNKMKKVKVRD